MIDVKDYILTYKRIKDNKEFKAKRVGTSHISILEDGESKLYTIYECRKHYKGSKENRKSKNKPKQSHVKIKNRFNTEAYKKYLDESSDKICTNF